MENYVYSVCPPKQTCYRISTYGFQIEEFLRKKFGIYVLFRGDFICNKFITIKKSGCSKKYFIKTGNILEVTTELNQYLNDFFYKNTVYDENVLALHGAAVECRQKAFIFLASTTSGKSTLASYLCSRGMGYIAEDCVLVDKDNFFIYPYSTPIHLREGGADVLKRKNIFPKENLDFILDDAFYERWHFRFVYMPSHVISKPVQLGAIFFIALGKKNEIFSIDAGSAIKKLLESPIKKYKVTPAFLQSIFRLAKLPVYYLKYRDMLFVEKAIWQLSFMGE